MIVPLIQRAYAITLGIQAPATGQEANLQDDFKFRARLIRHDPEIQASGEALAEALNPAITAVANLSQALDTYYEACKGADKRASDMIAAMHKEADQLDPSMLDPRLFDQ